MALFLVYFLPLARGRQVIATVSIKPFNGSCYGYGLSAMPPPVKVASDVRSSQRRHFEITVYIVCIDMEYFKPKLRFLVIKSSGD